MRAAGRSYNVALLSAAEQHGAAHQRPQAFQVVATVAGELLEDGKLDAQALAEASAAYPVTTLGRTGWLLDRLATQHGSTVDTRRLHRHLGTRSQAQRAGVPIVAGGTRPGHTDTRWGVVENSHVEPDL
jgi:hypothetical protein